ncbi:MAG: hypothetical protein M1838_001541 [Thelocarpon superellum]|nr:MAG: hypothetical protein M1838_001541 [Thelocarpon superellum]
MAHVPSDHYEYSTLEAIPRPSAEAWEGPEASVKPDREEAKEALGGNAIGSLDQASYDTRPPTGSQRTPWYRNSRWLAAVVVIAVLVIIAAVLGGVLGANKGATTSAASDTNAANITNPTTPSNISTTANPIPHPILGNSSLASACFPNGDRYVFFQDSSNEIKFLRYLASGASWSIQPDPMNLGADANTGMDVATYPTLAGGNNITLFYSQENVIATANPSGSGAWDVTPLTGSNPLLPFSKMAALWLGPHNATYLNVFIQNYNGDVSAIGKDIESNAWFNQWGNELYLYINPPSVLSGTGIGLVYNTSVLRPEDGGVTIYTQGETGLLQFTVSGTEGGVGLGTMAEWQGTSSTAQYPTKPGSDVRAMLVPNCTAGVACDIILYLDEGNALNLISGNLTVPISSQYTGSHLPSPRFSACLDQQTSQTIYAHFVVNDSAVAEVQWDVPTRTWMANATVQFHITG